nr:hypothetical protein [uncultured Aminipila sp.]
MFKKSKKTLTISILALLLVFIIGGVSYAVTYKTTEVHHEMLNTGVVFIWSDGAGNWQNGISPNSSCPRSFTINIGKDMKDVSVSAYNGSNFKFGSEETSHWNKTKMCKGKGSYDANYIPYAISSGSQTFSYDAKSGNITIKQSARLSSSKLFDVAYYVGKGKQQTVYDYLGDNIPSGITEPMNKMLTDKSVKGYLYFCPLVIKYTEVKKEVVEEPLELKAELELPANGKTNTPYPVKDITQIPKGATFQSSTLYCSSDNGQTYDVVNEWDCNTQNAQMNDSKITAGEYKYRLVVYLTNGQSSSDDKSIIIADKEPNITVTGEAHLVIIGDGIENGIPYGYEGHPYMMYDESIFYVTDEDGKTIKLSAEEAYAKGIARNKITFDTDKTDVSMKSFNKVEKEATWQHKGLKHITLTITIKDGIKYSDVVDLET